MMSRVKDLYPFYSYVTVDGRSYQFKHYARVIDVRWDDDVVREATVEIVLSPADYLNGKNYPGETQTLKTDNIPVELLEWIRIDKVGKDSE